MLELSYRTARQSFTQISIGTGILDSATIELNGEKVFFLYDLGIPGDVLSQVSAFVERLSENPVYVAVPAGEDAKSLVAVEETARELIAEGVRRNSLIVISGGGAVLDAGNFTASVLLRGLRTVLIPTTLLAMVDASIGGKTAVNLDSIKNMIGSFHQPERIIIELKFIERMSTKLIKSGMGEIIKTLYLAGKPEVLLMDEDEMIYIAVEESVRYKVGIVEQDPFETTGERKFLNFGHTIGHGIESAYIGKLTHGEAVANALAAEQYCAEKITGMNTGLAVEIAEIVERKGLLIRGFDVERIFSFVQYDKKAFGSSEVDLVYLKKPGEPAIIKVNMEELKNAAREFYERQQV